MRSELLRSSDPVKTASQLRRLIPPRETVEPAVREILSSVRRGGDRAIDEYTRRFDTRGADPPALVVSEEELAEAGRAVTPEVERGLRAAIDNVERVSRAWPQPDAISVDFEAHEVVLRSAPVRRAAVYVPGGRAPYPSTVVMGVITARTAGVDDVAVCAPPRPDGEVDPAVLGACALTGASRVYRMGGAQAIGALAYGADSVTSVDVIVGPGNLYVQEAKRQVSGTVGIDGFAGPSDLLLIAEGDVDVDALVLDLLAQAEHGPGTLVVALSSRPELLERLGEGMKEGAETGAVAALVKVADAEQALTLAEAFAPEHLQLAGASAEALAPRVTRAGALFVGERAGTAFGDYIAGSNHVLPTDGAARFASALNPAHFRRSFTEVRVRDGSSLATLGAPLARAESFELHARSMEARIRENPA